MICPVCNEDMIVVEYKGIELDYCTRCQGVWFDSGELRLLVRSLGFESGAPPFEGISSQPEPKHGEKHRRCPICRKKMRKLTFGNQPEIIIDACQRGDGLWFDGGELAQMLQKLAQQPQTEVSTQQQIANFLREVFQGTQSTSQK